MYFTAFYVDVYYCVKRFNLHYTLFNGNALTITNKVQKLYKLDTHSASLIIARVFTDFCIKLLCFVFLGFVIWTFIVKCIFCSSCSRGSLPVFSSYFHCFSFIFHSDSLFTPVPHQPLISLCIYTAVFQQSFVAHCLGTFL